MSDFDPWTTEKNPFEDMLQIEPTNQPVEFTEFKVERLSSAKAQQS